MSEFVTPEFLKNCSTDDFFKEITSILPSDIDLSEGSHAWNMTRPTALVLAKMCEYYLVEALQLILPEWSYGTFLDGHAKTRNIVRRAATAASGEITITGTAGTSIPAGSLFSTAAINDDPSVEYATTVSAKIPASGSVTIGIRCTQAGTVGNTAAGTIVLVSGKNTGITSVTNQAAITGGTEEESDISLRLRIEAHDLSQGTSYTGSVADYKQWATSVDGVGEATIISAQDDSGLVQIILTDSNGVPATEDLCYEVYNHIMRPDEPDKRLAPIGARLSVRPPDTMAIGIKATVELADNATIESVREAYMNVLADYLTVAFSDMEIKYTRVAAALASVDGVNDFADLQIGIGADGAIEYGTVNIRISESQLPTITEDNLILTAGTV